jgi:hypothetical protein
MSRDRVKTKLDKTGEVKAFSQVAMSNNHAVIDYCRTSMAALSGSTAGILGLPTLYGFAFYVVSVVGKRAEQSTLFACVLVVKFKIPVQLASFARLLE